MKRLLMAFGVVVAVLAIGVGATVVLVDWDGVRRDVLARAGKAAGLAFAIDGDVGFALLPRPVLAIEGVRIGPAGSAGDATILAVETVRVAPSILALLSGKIVINAVTLVGPSLTLERDARGEGNWQPLLDALKDDGDGGSPSPLTVRIRRGTIFLQDRVTGRDETIGGIAGRVSIPGEIGNFSIDAALQWRRMAITAVGSAARPDQAGQVPFDLALRSPGIGAATLSGRAVTTGADPTVEQGRFKLEAGDLIELMAKLGEPVDLPSSLRALSVTGTIAGTAKSATLDNLRLSLGASTATGKITFGLGDVPRVDIALKAGQIALDPFAEGKAGRSADVTLPRGLAGSIVLEVDAATFRGSALRQLRLQAALKDGVVQVAELKALAPGGTALDVTGQMTGTAKGLRLDGRLTSQTDDLRAFLAWLGAEIDGIASARLRRATATGAIVVDDAALAIGDLRAEFDSTFTTGSIRVPWDEKAEIGIDLALDRLDLDGYLDPDAAPKPATKPSSTPAARAVALRIGVAQLTVMSRVLQDARAEGRLDRGVLDLGAFAATAPGAATVSGSGRVKEEGGIFGFNGRIALESAEPAALARWFGIAPSPGVQALRPLSLAAAVVAGGEKIAASEIVASLGETGFTGSASIDRTGGRPRIVADLAVDSWAVPREEPGEAAPAPTGPRPIDFSWATGFDLDLRASAKELHALRYTVRDVRAVARVREQNVELVRMTGLAYGGWLRARGSVDISGERPAFTATVEAGEVDLAPLLSDAAGMDELSGKLHLSVSVKGAGTTDIDLIRGSDGTGRVVATDGAVRGFNLGRIARKIAGIENIGDLGDLMAATEAGGETPYSLIEGNVTIASGVVRTEDLLLRLDGGTGKANGWVDVAGLNVSMRGDVTFDDAPGKPSIGIVVRGVLDEPERELKTGELRRYIQKRINDAALGRSEPPPAENAVEEAIPRTIELPKPPRRFRK